MDKQIHDIKPKRKVAAKPRPIVPVPSYTTTDLDLTPKTVKRTTKRSTSTESADVPRGLVLTLQFLAYAIPLGFLAYVLYINYLPFGYEKTFTIDVGAEGDTSVGEFYLEPSPDLSERKIAPDGTTYRELNGMANVIFKPNVVLRDAEITVTVEGEGVEIIPPVIDFNPDEYEWDYEWDFTQKETAFTPKVSDRARAEWISCTTTATSTLATATTTETTDTTEIDEIVTADVSATSSADSVAQVCTPTPVPDLVGNAFFYDNQLTFNGRDSRLELPNSEDFFEKGPLTFYVEWTPQNKLVDSQQILGHFNWEIWQNSNSVEFRIGRMNDEKGEILTIKKVVAEDFFNVKHTLIASYAPFPTSTIKMYVDSELVSSINIGNDTIFSDYNKSQNLSLGWTPHNYSQAPFFSGTIQKIAISNSIYTQQLKHASFTLKNNNLLSIPIFSNRVSDLESIELNISQ